MSIYDQDLSTPDSGAEVLGHTLAGRPETETSESGQKQRQDPKHLEASSWVHQSLMGDKSIFFFLDARKNIYALN